MNNTQDTAVDEVFVTSYIQSEIHMRARQLSNPDSAYWRKIGHRPSTSCLKTSSDYSMEIMDKMKEIHPATFFYGPMPEEARDSKLLGIIWKANSKLNLVQKMMTREILKAEAERAEKIANDILSDSKAEAIMNNQNTSEDCLLG